MCVCVCVFGEGKGKGREGRGMFSRQPLCAEHVETGAWRRETSTLPTYRIMHA